MPENWKRVYRKINNKTERLGYDASDQGRIRNSKTHHIKNLHTSPNGYHWLSLYIPSLKRKKVRVRTLYVAHLVAHAFLGKRKPGMTIDHLDGNKKNNAVSNLKYVTMRENIIASYENGLRPKERRKGGSRNLSAGTYRRIQKLWDTGKWTQCDLGRGFGLNNSTVSKIVRGLFSARRNGRLELYFDKEQTKAWNR